MLSLGELETLTILFEIILFEIREQVIPATVVA